MIVHRSNFLRSIGYKYNYYSSLAAGIKESSEYTSVPVYPQIKDLSFKSKQKENVNKWHEKIKNLKTVEEKLLEINIPKYYGYKCTMFNDEKISYNSLPLIQFCTSTVFNEVEHLPRINETDNMYVDSFLANIKSDVENAIRFVFTEIKRSIEVNGKDLSSKDKDTKLSAAAIDHLNRIFINSLSADVIHLKDVEIENEARQEAFWFVNGINPPELLRKVKRGVTWQKDMADDSVPHAIQYIGQPCLALRHELPLEPFTTIAEKIDNVPVFKYDPRTLGYVTTHRHGTTIPGFWPGSIYEHCILTYQNRSNLFIENFELSSSDIHDMLHVIGIQSSFARLYGISCYHGFSTFNEITYPLATQTIITNGRLWSFYAYQLNTVLTGTKDINNKANECWGTKELKLFEEIDDKGNVIGLNDNVLKNIYHFYNNTPKKRDITMKPYLGKTEQKIADISDEERRIFLENTYKHMTSNRPRHRLVPEIYNWEKIYKVDHDTRPLAAKRRPFELKINPFKRRMDEHTPKYIPKIKRPEGSKNKWEKLYYP